MSFEDRDMLAELEARLGGADVDMDVDEDNAYLSLPPGEEAMHLSHAGGEDELCKALLTEGYVVSPLNANPISFCYSKRHDGRTRRDRTLRRTREWQAQLDQLVTAYLEYKVDDGEGPVDCADDKSCTMTAVDFFCKLTSSTTLMKLIISQTLDHATFVYPLQQYTPTLHWPGKGTLVLHQSAQQSRSASAPWRLTVSFTGFARA